MSRVKICGLKREEDVNIINQYKPDYIGFIFAPSRRQVSKEQARNLGQLLDPSIKKVGVFVDEEIEVIIQYLQEGIIDIAQLHGSETEEMIGGIKKITSKPIIKAVSVTDIKDILQWENSQADFLLLDHGKGGTGEKFNWSILNELQESSFTKPYFVAGGLSTENVGEMLSYHPYGVDVSSGVEIDGVKDEIRIREFMQAIG